MAPPSFYRASASWIGSQRGLIKSFQVPDKRARPLKRKEKKKKEEEKRKVTGWKLSGFSSREISSITENITLKMLQIHLEKLIILSFFQLVGGDMDLRIFCQKCMKVCNFLKQFTHTSFI